MFGNFPDDDFIDESERPSEVFEYDPRTRKERHRDYFDEHIARHPDSECFVVIDEDCRSVSGVRAGKSYSIAHCFMTDGNFDDDGTRLTGSLTRDEYGAPWITEFVPVARLHKTREDAVAFLDSMVAEAALGTESMIEKLRADMVSINKAASAVRGGASSTPLLDQIRRQRVRGQGGAA